MLQQYLEEAEERDNEVKLWRSLFVDMTDKLKAYNAEMMRCQVCHLDVNSK